MQAKQPIVSSISEPGVKLHCGCIVRRGLDATVSGTKLINLFNNSGCDLLPGLNFVQFKVADGSVLVADPGNYMTTSKIIYTQTDEAPALATYSLLPIVQTFAKAAGVLVETRDISLSGRIIAAFSDRLATLNPEEKEVAAKNKEKWLSENYEDYLQFKATKKK